jgi:AraC-like DNA-binding protein
MFRFPATLHPAQGRLSPGAIGLRLVRDGCRRRPSAIAWIKDNYAKPLRVEELAEIAGMGVSTLHHHFRALTAMSPLGS